MFICVRAHICRGQKTRLGVLFIALHRTLLRQGLPLNLDAGLMDIPSEPPTFTLDSVGVTGRHSAMPSVLCGFWDLNYATSSHPLNLLSRPDLLTFPSYWAPVSVYILANPKFCHSICIERVQFGYPNICFNFKTS